MHIAVVCRAIGLPGGVAGVALRQARELTRHAEVTLISDSLLPEGNGGEAAEAPIGFAHAPIADLHVLRRFRHVPDELLFARAARRALFDVHRVHPIHFVLCHSHAVSHLAAHRFAAKSGARAGLFVHGDISDRPRGTYDPRLTAFYRWVTPRAYRSADVVFALAAPFAEIARRAGAGRVEVVPNGIDPADIGIEGTEPAVDGRRSAEEALRVLYVGRLAVEKGLSYLIEAFAAIEKNVTLDLVGAGPLEPELRSMIEALGLAGRVRLIGVRPRGELGAIYRAHHLFCTPALSEPFASVITEALVSGIPVIGTSVGGIPDVVEHGKNGLVVPPADPRALAEAISTLARDEVLRLSLAAHARSSVLPRLAWRSIGDRIAAVITMIA